MAARSADIIPIGVKLKRNCGNCLNAALGSFGVWCDTYQEPIWDENEARRCDNFVPQ